jgi:release factor glutamine methyltransferase
MSLSKFCIVELRLKSYLTILNPIYFMRVKSNKLQDLINFYSSELSHLYEAEEIDALTKLCLEHFLGFSPHEIAKRAAENINQSDLIKLYDCCIALKNNIPIQYVLGEAWFYGLKFKVTSAVLIPRPETEELLDIVIKAAKPRQTFLDIGTGSGCISVGVKKNITQSTVTACDISASALAIAAFNAQRHQTEIRFIETNILQIENFQQTVQGTFDVIISNPPYVKASETSALEKRVFDFEPHLALFVADANPIIFYKKIIDLCKTTLAKKGDLYFELNPMTAIDVETYAQNSGLFSEMLLLKDMSGKVRFLKATKF